MMAGEEEEEGARMRVALMVMKEFRNEENVVWEGRTEEWRRRRR